MRIKTVRQVIRSCIIYKRFSVRPLEMSEFLIQKIVGEMLQTLKSVGCKPMWSTDLEGKQEMLDNSLYVYNISNIPLKMAISLSTDSFILADRRLIARRSRSTTI
ncbi:hypothetical protein NPIL_418541 [Nephila pilipes]|uniref:Uncharacterized protein n=1 Tax=Nephila pilipes TaxID=299642 RepID=A0A8X6IKJ6_NEPPI|nr:hypothetical protein NPIL_418541 [Nephila pilipes]